MNISRKSVFLSASLASVIAFSPFSHANTAQQPIIEEDDNNAIIVTGARIRQGGAQDIKHFRSVSLDGSFLPPSSSLTLEGLMGEHDLTLPPQGACDQLFCLTAHSMEAGLPNRPQDKYFVGLGFASNIDAETWKRAPLNLIAVVDRSGSMSGAPIATAKAGLKSVLAQMNKGDRIGIVIYGSDTVVHLAPTDVAGNEGKIERAINSIAINGSTYMEAGLKLGYQTAFEEAGQFDGKTRLMLFTDENPNVGDTSPEGFMALAEAGSLKNVGLTTIGVGVHFDGALATKVSSVRGGNLFFLDEDTIYGDDEDYDDDERLNAKARSSVRRFFDGEFRNMVSEVAHDVKITMTPQKGYAVTGVFGVPDGLMREAQDGAITVTVPSAFLSSNGGGIYASMGKASDRANLPVAPIAEGAPLMNVSLSYVDAVYNKPGADQLAVAVPQKRAPERLVAAQLLVDQYLTLKDALDAFHKQEDKKLAYRLLYGLHQRMDNAPVKNISGERKLIKSLAGRAAFLAGYSSELPTALKPKAVLGEWRVKSYDGVDDVARGDLIRFTEYGEMVTERKKQKDDIRQDVQINEKQIYLTDADLVFNYRMKGDRLRLETSDQFAKMTLERVSGGIKQDALQ